MLIQPQGLQAWLVYGKSGGEFDEPCIEGPLQVLAIEFDDDSDDERSIIYIDVDGMLWKTSLYQADDPTAYFKEEYAREVLERRRKSRAFA